MKIPIFDNFSDAFHYCKIEDQPTIVEVNGQDWKLYPNGTAHPISDELEITVNIISQFADDDEMLWTQTKYYWDEDKQEMIERQFGENSDQNPEKNI